MNWNFMFLVNSILLGIGLSMDAFSVSMANGLNEPQMRRRKSVVIAEVFAGFQALMPLTGWFCVHTAARYFTAFQPLIPWIALVLLAFIGGKMLIDGLHNQTESESTAALGPAALIVQGIATSIDALSVGFTIADYNGQMALAAALIIAAVTFVICMAGVSIGKKFGTRLSNKAQI
ncbi:MAG: manganese efflux pump MntP family protein, partial [Clostridiales bacterium]|nr:manganese efflux pump MntP family protein [Clostridiales bacterium]